MATKKTDLAIVNRGFWPQSQVIGEALLQLAEKVASRHSVCVITQSDGKLHKALSTQGRGHGVSVMDCLSHSDSASGLVRRSLDAMFFMLWTLVHLIKCRPAMVYVSTNPPVLVPFIVFLYCRLSGARYCYHLQDIHPEATNIIVPLNRLVYRTLLWMDAVVMRHADSIITLSEDMRACILARSCTKAPIHLIDNPAFNVDSTELTDRTGDIVFCGNAGRLQRVPLLLQAIRAYLQQGGSLRFSFVGGGVYAPQIAQLAGDHDEVTFHGFLPAAKAADIVNQHRWALMPIDDEVTKYAFPSKSSSYVLSGCRILAICGRETSVARWVSEHNVGRVCPPDKDSIVESFLAIERCGPETVGSPPQELIERFHISYFVERVKDVLGWNSGETEELPGTGRAHDPQGAEAAARKI
jgi:hypothetical protein